MTTPSGKQRIEPEHGTFRSGDVTLHYVDWGGDSPDVVVLLHGFSSQARYWDGFAVRVRDRFRVYSLDQRGHGRSGWADDYTADAMPSDVEAFAEHLGIDRFVLIGHSMGGLVSMRYTAFHPGRVRALVVVDADGHRLGGEAHSEMDNSVTRALTPTMFESEAAVMAHYATLVPDFDAERARPALMHNFETLPDGRVRYCFDPAVLPQLLPEDEAGRHRNKAALADQIERSASVACPVLVLRGGLSDILDPEQARATAAMFPRGRVQEIPGTTHMIPTDDPTAFREAVVAFLDAELSATQRSA